MLFRSVDLATGHGTVIGRVGFPNIFGLAFAPDGTLFGATNGNPPSLLVIDTATGAGTPVGTISNTNGITGLTYARVSGRPGGRAPNLIVLVHGCCTNANDVINDWYTLGNEIAKKIKKKKKWEIVVWDWTKCTSDPNVECTPKPSILDVPNYITQVNTAYTYALFEGRELAVAIANYPYKHVHFIGHSAGAKLIDEAAFQIALNNTDQPFLHITFLDAYTRDDNDTINYSGFPVGYPHYVEHYVDRGLPSTDACLSNAFNFNISNWDRLSVGERGFGGHQWPRNWYKRSVTSTSPKFRYGYTLSLEGGNDRFDELATLHPPGNQCGLDTGLFNENPNPDCQQAACPFP